MSDIPIDHWDKATGIANEQRKRLVDANAIAAGAQAKAVTDAQSAITGSTSSAVSAALADARSRNSPDAAVGEITHRINEAPLRRIGSLAQSAANRTMDRENRAQLGLGQIDATIGRLPLMKGAVDMALQQARDAAEAKAMGDAARAAGRGGGKGGGGGGGGGTTTITDTDTQSDALSVADVLGKFIDSQDQQKVEQSSPYNTLEEMVANYQGDPRLRERRVFGLRIPGGKSLDQQKQDFGNAIKTLIGTGDNGRTLLSTPGSTYMGVSKQAIFNALAEQKLHPSNRSSSSTSRQGSNQKNTETRTQAQKRSHTETTKRKAKAGW